MAARMTVYTEVNARIQHWTQALAKSDNGHGRPLSSELMSFRTSHRATSLPVSAIPRVARDGEVTFIRYAATRSTRIVMWEC